MTGGGVAIVDVDLVIPPSLDVFWQNVRSDGNDMLLVEGNGLQPISLAAGNATAWDRGAVFNTTTKVGSIRIDGWQDAGNSKHPPIADRMMRLFLYYDFPTAAIDLTDGVIGALTPRAASIAEEHPFLSRPQIRTALERDGDVRPKVRLSKMTGETAKWYWNYKDELAKRFSAVNNRRRFEEVKFFNLDAESGGVADNSVVTEVDSQFVSDDVISTVITGGTDGQTHTVKLKLFTTEGRTLERRALLVSNNVKD